jgi:hypothetical protein
MEDYEIDYETQCPKCGYDISHRELCLFGSGYMKNNGIIKWNKPAYVVCELERSNAECPDVFGFGGAYTQLIEVKVSHSDFIADKKKHWRKNPCEGLGQLRAYLCPAGIIDVNELPDKWGLFYCENGKIETVKEPEIQTSSSMQEMNLAASILRREGIKSKILSYRYKTNREWTGN